MNTTNTSIHWTDDFLLGFGPMDETHQEFVTCIAAIQNAEPKDCLVLMDQLLEHATAHFKQEDDWMMTTEFPPRTCHMDEHAAVLASITGVRALARQGATEKCLHLANDLARWFPSHADHLDSALSHWMCKIKYGAKPLVFKRSVANVTA
ncbi:hemerythrin domain-containing protein [Limnohabitans sp. Rim8]|uniref:hemerythrin domain-containing protein n=1 Tax=Limnohabitans sp. Rim8 TaxID=1100718 RepID=UPI0025DC2FC3|nr:hemerythrin domain-containing protein [Limnohabitans sp. Rim8]